MFNKTKLKKDLNTFLKLYKKRPIKNNHSGMKIDHCFALFCLLKKIKPKFVIESGVWKGQTTWLIKKVLKNAKIYSIDIDLSNREVNYKDVKYLNKDITKYNWKSIDKNKTLIIFDDHVCFSERLKFLLKNKFKHIIFDDNLPNEYIWYYTPKMIYEKQILVVKQFIRYTNLSRILKLLIKFLFNKKFLKNTKINFSSTFLKVIYPPKLNKKLKKDFIDFRKKIKIYYEFPPIIEFNYLKRFKYTIKNFNEKNNFSTYKVSDPITNLSNIKIEKKISDELNEQYSNICYLNLR
jgi:hypothetical protein|tara:strand:- start:1144 stop:2022 length:879 start_codon:yes stop_codon:yes gene_type:complete